MAEQKQAGRAVVVARTDRWVMRRRIERKDDGRTITYYTFEPAEQDRPRRASGMEAGRV